MNKILQFILKNRFKKETFTIKLYRESVLINTITVPSGTVVNLSTYVPVTLGGYVFNGWNTTNTYKVTPDYSSSGSITITKDISLYASYHFTVYKYVSGSLYTSGSYAKGSSVTLGSASKSPSYYNGNYVSNWSFYGWSISNDTTLMYGSSGAVSTNIAVYAIFTGSYTASSTSRVSNTVNSNTEYIFINEFSLSFTNPSPNSSVSMSLSVDIMFPSNVEFDISICVRNSSDYVLNEDHLGYNEYIYTINKTFNIPAFILKGNVSISIQNGNNTGSCWSGYIKASANYSYDATTTSIASVTSN